MLGATSNFSKGEWYKCSGTSGPNDLDLFVEHNMEKYRIQRRAVEPAHSAEAMKDLEPDIDFIMKNNIAITKKRAGEPTDIDIFCNMFVLSMSLNC
jgi:hypothetical protein